VELINARNSTTPPTASAIDATSFLRHILPLEGEGFYCATIFSSKDQPPANRFFTEISALAAFIATCDANGRSTYHACGAYREAGRRKQVNSRGARALWCEIDLRKKDGTVIYETKWDAVTHVLEFCREFGLPPPVFVDSGHGIHCYWVFVLTLEANEWIIYARGLRTAIQQFGLRVDPARTCDIASILRTHGTHNRKGGGCEPVVAANLDGPYEKAAFATLLTLVPTARQVGTRKNTSSGRASLGKVAAATVANIYDADPADAAAIARNCGQFANFFMANGNQSEPVWFANLGIAAYCHGGDEIAHRVSSGDKRYTEADTQERLDRIRRVTTGATTCARFHDELDAETRAVCEACPHWAKSTVRSASVERGGQLFRKMPQMTRLRNKLASWKTAMS
jgi:hypothetical protein